MLYNLLVVVLWWGEWFFRLGVAVLIILRIDWRGGQQFRSWRGGWFPDSLLLPLDLLLLRSLLRRDHSVIFAELLVELSPSYSVLRSKRVVLLFLVRIDLACWSQSLLRHLLLLLNSLEVSVAFVFEILLRCFLNFLVFNSLDESSLLWRYSDFEIGIIVIFIS